MRSFTPNLKILTLCRYKSFKEVEFHFCRTASLRMGDLFQGSITAVSNLDREFTVSLGLFLLSEVDQQFWNFKSMANRNRIQRLEWLVVPF
jgi:hypothetical protein